MKMGAYLTLKINGRTDTTLYKGDYAMLTLTVACPELDDVARENSIIDMDIEEINESFKKGEIPSDEYASKKANLEKAKRHPEKVIIGGTGKPWYDEAEFKMSLEEGQYERLPWKGEVVTKNPETPELELAPHLNASMGLLIRPDVFEKVKEDLYALKAVIGEDESNEVLVDVSHGADPDPMDVKQAANVHYLLADEEQPKALSMIKKMLKKDPDSVEGYSLMGAYYEVRNDAEKALESYVTALKTWEKKNPGEEDLPRKLYAKIMSLASQQKD